jgi:hypothetical protein
VKRRTDVVRKRKLVALGAIAAVGLGLFVIWLMVQDIIEGSHVVGEGYPEMSVRSELPRLVIALLVLFVAVLAAWYYLRAKPEPKRKKKPSGFVWPSNIPPCDGGIPPAGLPPSSPPGAQSIGGR